MRGGPNGGGEFETSLHHDRGGGGVGLQSTMMASFTILKVRGTKEMINPVCCNFIPSLWLRCESTMTASFTILKVNWGIGMMAMPFMLDQAGCASPAAGGRARLPNTPRLRGGRLLTW